MGASTKSWVHGNGFEDPGATIPPEITNITAITDEMVAGQSIDDNVVNENARLVAKVGRWDHNHHVCGGLPEP